jgi:hypothetical protein
MPCCRKASGAATGRHWSRQCPLRAPSWGDPAPLLSAAAQAAAGRRPGGQGAGALTSDPRDGLAAALARLGQAFMARNA